MTLMWMGSWDLRVACMQGNLKLITGEDFENADPILVQEYNELTYQLNREIYLLSDKEVLQKHNRIKELNSLLGIGFNKQLVLF